MAVLFSFLLTLSLCSCTVEEKKTEVTDADVEEMLAAFEELSKIPRGSGNEKEVSDFLFSWAQEVGENAVQDEHLNVIFDIPATKGCESSPLTILQAHMDMVVVADENAGTDPFTEGILPVRDGDWVRAEGTSLGADDGGGLILIKYLIGHAEKHGPLRVIFTTREEVSDAGASYLDTAYFSDASYLINMDGENAGEFTVSSARCEIFSALRKTVTEENSGELPLELRVSGGQGGHSGLDIGKGRCNAIREMAEFLNRLQEKQIGFQLVSLTGGTAFNSIPGECRAVVTVREEFQERLISEAEAFEKELKADYAEKDPGVGVEVLYPNLYVDRTISAADTAALISFLCACPQGIHSEVPGMEGVVESSSNIGIVSASDKECLIKILNRSCEEEEAVFLLEEEEKLAGDLGFTYTSEITSCSWSKKEDSRLVETAERIYEKQNGEAPDIIFSHGGLETGFFAARNRNLDMICLGPTVVNAHSTQEALYVPSLKVTARLVKGILSEIAGE